MSDNISTENDLPFISRQEIEALINKITAECEKVCEFAKANPEIPYGFAYDFNNAVKSPMREFIKSLPTLKFKFETPDEPTDALVCAMEILNGTCHPSTYSRGILEAAHRVYKKEIKKI
jgi:hypothetical protein